MRLTENAGTRESSRRSSQNPKSEDLQREAIDAGLLQDLLNPYLDAGDGMIEKICREFMARVYMVFKPSNLSQIDYLLDKHKRDYFSLIVSICDKYLKEAHGSAEKMIEDIVFRVAESDRAERSGAASSSSSSGQNEQLIERQRKLDKLTQNIEEMKKNQSRPSKVAQSAEAAPCKEDEEEEEEPDCGGDDEKKDDDQQDKEEKKEEGGTPAVTLKPSEQQKEAEKAATSKAAPAKPPHLTGGARRRDLHEPYNPNHPSARQDLARMDIDAEKPQELPKEFLDRIFEGQRKLQIFMLWIPNKATDHPKVRVNAKFSRNVPTLNKLHSLPAERPKAKEFPQGSFSRSTGRGLPTCRLRIAGRSSRS